MTADADNRLAPKVLVHDEATFNPEDVGQATRSNQPQSRASVRYSLPWEAWITSAAAQVLSVEAQDIAAISLVLSSFHKNPAFLLRQPVSVVVEDKLIWAQATKEIDAGDLLLPPCVPKSMKVVKESNVMTRVAIRLCRSTSPSVDSTAWPSTPSRARVFTDPPTYYIHPDFRMPQDVSAPGAPEPI